MSYRIGTFAELSGVSRKTLRFYDQIGLLEPAAVDVRTGYRKYTEEQLREVAEIAELKELGASLTQILQIRRHKGAQGERERLLASLKALAKASIEQRTRELKMIDGALEELASQPRAVPIIVKIRPATLVASVRSRVADYSEMERYRQELLCGLPPECIGELQGVLWHSCADAGLLEGEAFVQIRRSVPKGIHQVKELASATMACAYSSFDDIEAESTYDALRRWMHMRGYRLCGAKREIRFGNLLEIQFPLQTN